MRIGILSDTHGSMVYMQKALKQMGEVDYILHLGDYYADAVRISQILNRKIIAVKGNCDFSTEIPLEKEIVIQKRKILMTHGHQYQVKWTYERIFYKGEEARADLVLFGHTHVPLIQIEGKTIYMNPGSIGEPRGGKSPSFGIVHFHNERIVPSIHTFE